ncbi:ScbR family autoregulator-binding transcription factor [Kitasatospora sp. NPDC048239]|uniref:ScbR family autoregulator-binding transcription factor n=1 Tax=Kitasatospora sp. NPDC048239 TaxID=3364046 RepID=UPI0037122D9D
MQERSERTRGRLVEAGAAQFDRSGYAGATLGGIAGAAGVTKGALYFHFASKEELARAVVERAETAVRGGCTAGAGVSPLQGLIDAGFWLVRVLESDVVVRAGFRLGREEELWSGGVTVAGSGVGGLHGVWAQMVRELLASARRAGELRARSGGVGVESLAVAAACGLEVVHGSGCGGDELARRLGALWEWLLPCLVPPGAVGGYRTSAPQGATGP